MSQHFPLPPQVKQAEKRGAIGVILFSDPADITAGDVDKVYPDDWWLPPSGAQRGSIYIGVGDPLTPGYPAIGKLIDNLMKS